MSVTTTLLRHEPVQARSNARLSALLDAAAVTIDKVGYERLTTAMVAERANASIGTVYRYFPDRIAVLQGVAARATERFVTHIDTTLATRSHANWWEALEEVIDDFVGAFSGTPAFASLRFGDVLDLRPRENDGTRLGVVTERIAHLLVARHGMPEGNELTFTLEVVFTLLDTLLARAFLFDPKGDAAYIDEARALAHRHMTRVFGEPATH